MQKRDPEAVLACGLEEHWRITLIFARIILFEFISKELLTHDLRRFTIHEQKKYARWVWAGGTH